MAGMLALGAVSAPLVTPTSSSIFPERPQKVFGVIIIYTGIRMVAAKPKK
jgi:uncharacterized membrane protein YfcA